jgi:hypothetical protein
VKDLELDSGKAKVLAEMSTESSELQSEMKREKTAKSAPNSSLNVHSDKPKVLSKMEQLRQRNMPKNHNDEDTQPPATSARKIVEGTKDESDEVARSLANAKDSGINEKEVAKKQREMLRKTFVEEQSKEKLVKEKEDTKEKEKPKANIKVALIKKQKQDAP